MIHIWVIRHHLELHVTRYPSWLLCCVSNMFSHTTASTPHVVHYASLSLPNVLYKHFFHNTSQKNISISHFFRHF